MLPLEIINGRKVFKWFLKKYNVRIHLAQDRIERRVLVSVVS
jgi:hypothetical protein